MNLLFLSQADVLASGGADMAAAIADAREGFALFMDGKINQPHKVTLKDSKHDPGSIINFMPVSIETPTGTIISCKSVSVMAADPIDVPRIEGLITLFDPATKAPLCIMDGAVISAMRTGAVTAVAAAKLAELKATEIGLIGAGVNMRTQLFGLQAVLPKLQRVRVYSRGRSKHDFARDLSQRLHLDIVPVDTAEAAVRDLPIVVNCIIPGGTPFIDSSWLNPAGFSLFNVGGRVIDPEILQTFDRIVVDSWEHSRHRGGQTHALAVEAGVLDPNRIEDLGPILAGDRLGRESPHDRIYFSPVGMGFADGLVADRVYRAALAAGRGTTLELHSDQPWI